MKVLIVGDDTSLLEQQAREWGYETAEAANGQEAWLTLKDEVKPVVVLADLADGDRLCGRLKRESNQHQFYVILMTGTDSRDSVTRGLEAGADDFVIRPALPAELRSSLGVGRRVLECQYAVEHLTCELQAKARELARMVTLDGLTGISCRASFDERLSAEWRRALREGAPISLALFDIDFFKAYNDMYGHTAGDECLKKIAQTAAVNVGRAGDFIARFGGEEFAALLPNTDRLGTLVVAEAVRVAVATLGIEHKASPIHRYLTVSAGTATMVPAEGVTPEALIAKADVALFRAKQVGRNLVKQAN